MFKTFFKTWYPSLGVCCNLVRVETPLRLYLTGVRVGVIRQNLQKLTKLIQLAKLI